MRFPFVDHSMDILKLHLTIGINTGTISPRARAHITRGDVAQLGAQVVRIRSSLPYMSCLKHNAETRICAHSGFGALAQLGEHHVRNVGVGGSNPLGSTKTDERQTEMPVALFCV